MKIRKRTYLITIDEEWDPRFDELCLRGKGFSLIPVNASRSNPGYRPELVAHNDYRISTRALEYAKHDVKSSGVRRIAEGLVNEVDKHTECHEQFALVGAATLLHLEEFLNHESRLNAWTELWGLE